MVLTAKESIILTVIFLNHSVTNLCEGYNQIKSADFHFFQQSITSEKVPPLIQINPIFVSETTYGLLINGRFILASKCP